MSPTSHIRKVIAGMSGSSTFDTDALTSGYGLSSSSIASKSNSILLKEVSDIGIECVDLVDMSKDEKNGKEHKVLEGPKFQSAFEL